MTWELNVKCRSFGKRPCCAIIMASPSWEPCEIWHNSYDALNTLDELEQLLLNYLFIIVFVIILKLCSNYRGLYNSEIEKKLGHWMFGLVNCLLVVMPKVNFQSAHLIISNLKKVKSHSQSRRKYLQII